MAIRSRYDQISSVEIQLAISYLEYVKNTAQLTYLKTSVLTCNKMIRQQLQHNMAVTLNTAFKCKHNDKNTFL